MGVTINTVNVTFIKMKSSYHRCNATVKEIVGEEQDENSFEVIDPMTGKLCEKEFNRVNERRLYVSEWEVEGVGVTTDFGAEVDVGERAVGSDLDSVEYMRAEGSDKEVGVVVEVGVAGDVVEEVFGKVLFLWNPELFSTFVDDRVLVRVVVSGGGAGRGGEEVGKGFELVVKWVMDNGGNVFRSRGNGYWGWDGEDGGSSDRRWEILNGDVREGNTNKRIFELSVGIFVLVPSGPLEYGAIEGL